MLRILHTSDWHLGHSLHDLPREREQAAFLDWLRKTLVAQQVDALIIAGDVFDVAHPAASAQRQWYQLLASLWREMPRLELIVIGGNHDSAARLDAPRPMLEALGRLHVVGSLPRRPDGSLDEDTLLIPLRGSSQEVEAWVAAIPFLRPSDLPSGPLVQGIEAVHKAVFDAATRRRTPQQALLATGHAYFVGGQLSERSERKIQCGNQEALPVSLFPEAVTYGALGHLHLAQKVGGRETLRYSGAPLPLSMDEASYPSQVLLLTLNGAAPPVIASLPVPRPVPFLRIPAKGALLWDDLLTALRALPARGEGAEDEGAYPYLEVCIEQEGLDPNARTVLQALLDQKQVRLVKISQAPRQSTALAATTFQTRASLHEVTPEEVLEFAWTSDRREGVPPEPLRASFAQLVEWAHDPKEADRQRALRPLPAPSWV